VTDTTLAASGLMPEPRVATRRNLAALAMRAGYRLQVTGGDRVPPWGPLLVVANHAGVIDAMVLAAATPRPLHVMETDDDAVGPLLGPLDAMGRIPSAAGTLDREALLTAVAALAEERAVAVFPEGRVGDGDVALADHVTGYLLARTGVQVLPVALLGTRRPGDPLQSVPRWRSRLEVVFADPVSLSAPISSPTRADCAGLGERVRQLLHDHVALAVRRTGVPLPSTPHPGATR
jgi:1-acyl-sn-glycerol-3-phosphate acyltransferase